MSLYFSRTDVSQRFLDARSLIGITRRVSLVTPEDIYKFASHAASLFDRTTSPRFAYNKLQVETACLNTILTERETHRMPIVFHGANPLIRIIGVAVSRIQGISCLLSERTCCSRSRISFAVKATLFGKC